MIKYDSSHPDYRPSWEQWNLRVDATGVPVPAGLESDNDYFARPAMPFIYKGTVDGISAADRKRNPGFTWTASTPEEKRQDAERVGRIMFALAQVPNGRELIDFLNYNKTAIEVRPAETRLQGACAINDIAGNRFWVNPNLDTVDGLRCLSHEGEHAEKNVKGFWYGSRNSLKSALALVAAQEAAANMRSALSVAQFVFDQPGDHPRRWKPKDIEKTYDNDPAFKATFMRAGRHIQSGNVAEFAFEAFAAKHEQLKESAYYHGVTVKFFANNAPSLPEGALKLSGARHASLGSGLKDFMTSNVSQAYIENTLTIAGQTYLKGRGLILDQPVLSSDPTVRDSYQKLQEQLAVLNHHSPHHAKSRVALKDGEAVSQNAETQDDIINPWMRLRNSLGVKIDTASESVVRNGLLYQLKTLVPHQPNRALQHTAA